MEKTIEEILLITKSFNNAKVEIHNYYFAIASAFNSEGIFSIAYLSEVLGIVPLFFITYSNTSC